MAGVEAFRLAPRRTLQNASISSSARVGALVWGLRFATTPATPPFDTGGQATSGTRRTIDELVERIEKAFADVEHPGERRLVDPDDKFSRSEIEGFFPNVHWRDVTPETFEKNCDALAFFTPEAWQFYLPAFLIWSLKSFRTSDSAAVDFTTYNLALVKGGSLRKFGLSRFSRITEEQAKAVVAFLEFMRDNTDGMADEAVATEALDEYWYKLNCCR